MKVYFVILVSDVAYKVKIVDEETFEWISSSDLGRPIGYNEYQGGPWVDQMVPQSQINKMMTAQGDRYKPLKLGGDLYSNDRALNAISADGYERHYGTVWQAVKAILERGDVIAEDEFVGELY